MRHLQGKTKRLHGSRLIYALILLFLAIKLFLINDSDDVWWDSAVYIGMGKHIYSSGHSGLWEASRPLTWPLIMGFLWKIGLDEIFIGRIIEIMLGSLCLLLTYKIALRLFGSKTAIIASLFLAFSPTFFNFSGIMLSEIASTSFFLLGFYFFITGKKAMSGLFFGISFMTRFFQIFAILPLLLLSLYLACRKKGSLKSFAAFLACFLLPAIAYLLLNTYLYSDPLYPFILQAYMTKETGWVFHQPIYFYFAGLLKENFLAIFALVGFAAAMRKKSLQTGILLIVFIFPFILYNLSDHKEMRLMIPLLPFLYILAGSGILYTSGLFGKYGKFAALPFLILWAFTTIPQLKTGKYSSGFDAFYGYAESLEPDGGIWISNPAFIAFSDKKADELIYYPLYNSQKSALLQAKAGKASAVLLNTCDILPCPPSDTGCKYETEKLISIFRKSLRLKFYEMSGNCERMIFEK